MTTKLFECSEKHERLLYFIRALQFGLHNDLGSFTGLQAPNAKLLSSGEFVIHSALQSRPSHEFVQVKFEISTQIFV
jgi:hypothetical protein